MMTNPISLEFRSLCKDYGVTRALHPFSHCLGGGKIHALIGKNGSGKSTLIKMVAGATQPTSGEILLNGEVLQLRHPNDAMQAGLITIHQELSLIPELSVAENIFLGRMPKSRGFIHWRTLNQHAQRLLHDMGADEIKPASIVNRLSVGRKQVVEIAKAMSFAPKVLQLDEPTSALAQDEVASLFKLLRRLRDQGVLIIYVSHRLSELPEIADDVVVLRDGKYIGAAPMSTATPQVLVDMMFGDIEAFTKRGSHHQQSGEVALEVENLSIDGLLHNISFKLYKGEVLGIAGMLGSGRTELLRGIYGADPIQSGRISVAGKIISNPTPQKMRALGVGYTSEDRKEKGLVQALSCHANLCLAALNKISPRLWTTVRRETPYVKKQITDLGIKVANQFLLVSSLSGGNQQKIVVGNWLNIQPKVLLFDEPGRGIDVQAKQQIFQLIWTLADQGLAAIVVSTDLEELPGVCDRILVLKSGRIGQELGQGVGVKALYEACMTRHGQ